jgi:dienelactone hydrolase
MWNPRANFAAYIPLYASCSATLIGDTDISAAPLRQFHGMADDWVTVAPCRPHFERLRAAGRDVKLTEYPDAHHSYDNPLGSKTPAVSKDAQSTRDYFFRSVPMCGLLPYPVLIRLALTAVWLPAPPAHPPATPLPAWHPR